MERLFLRLSTPVRGCRGETKITFDVASKTRNLFILPSVIVDFVIKEIQCISILITPARNNARCSHFFVSFFLSHVRKRSKAPRQSDCGKFAYRKIQHLLPIISG